MVTMFHLSSCFPWKTGKEEGREGRREGERDEGRKEGKGKNTKSSDSCLLDKYLFMVFQLLTQVHSQMWILFLSATQQPTLY